LAGGKSAGKKLNEELRSIYKRARNLFDNTESSERISPKLPLSLTCITAAIGLIRAVRVIRGGMVTIGRLSRAFPRSKPDRRLSSHPAFEKED